MKHISKVLAILTYSSLNCKEPLITSNLNKVQIELKENKHFKTIVQNINVKDNNLYCQKIDLFFQIFNKTGVVNSQAALIVLKKHQPSIVKINAFGNQIKYEKITIISKNIHLHIDFQNTNKNEIMFEPGCLIKYKDFKLEVKDKITYFEEQINTKNLLLEYVNFKEKVSIESIVCNTKQKLIMGLNLNMNYSPINLIAKAKTFKYENDIGYLSDTVIKIKDMNSTVECIQINRINNVNLQNINMIGKKFSFYSPSGKLNYETKQVIFKDCEIKTNKMILKIKQVLMNLDTKRADLLDIIVLSNNKEISKCKSGTLNLNLESGKMSYNLSYGNINT